MEMTLILTILLLNILLPTADIVTDINLVYSLYSKALNQYQPIIPFNINNSPTPEHIRCSAYDCWFFYPRPEMVTVLLMPCLLNYIVCFYTFFRLTKERKRYLFIFPLLNLYPQYGKTHSS